MLARPALWVSLAVAVACSPEADPQVPAGPPPNASLPVVQEHAAQTRSIAGTGETTVPPNTRQLRIGAVSDSGASDARLRIEHPGPLSWLFGWSLVSEIPLSFEAGAGHWHDIAIDIPLGTKRVRLSLVPEGVATSVTLSRPAWIRGRVARNLILISLDTLRADMLGSYGYTRFPTSPGIDRFATRGALFEQVIAPSPWTVPSHMAVFTGTDPDALGLDEFATKTPRLHPEVTTLAELFRERGALTAAFTGSGTMGARNGFSDGFFLYQESPRDILHSDLTINLERADDWLRAQATTPFFLFLHTFEIHNPYSHAELATPDLDDADRQRALYASGIAYVDRHLSSFLDALRADGLLEDTLVVIMSDHGEGFADDHTRYHGRTLFDDVLRVPLILVGPDIPAGRRVAAQVPLQDLFATLTDYFELSAPEDIESASLLPMLAAPAAPARDTYLCCMAHHFQREGFRAGGFKFVLSHRRGKLQRDLFDLERDPGEQHNVAGEQPEILDRMLTQTYLRSAANRSRAARQPMPSRIDDDYLEQLRVLGYAE